MARALAAVVLGHDNGRQKSDFARRRQCFDQRAMAVTVTWTAGLIVRSINKIKQKHAVFVTTIMACM